MKTLIRSQASCLYLCERYGADLEAMVVRKSLPVRSIRVKEFMGTAQLASSDSDIGFVLAVSLEEGLSRTLCYGFMENN